MKWDFIEFLRKIKAKVSGKTINRDDRKCNDPRYPFVVYVGMENISVLAKEETFMPAVYQKMGTDEAVAPALCFSESPPEDVPLNCFCRRFFLQSEEVFPVFQEAMLAIPGVTAVVKGAGPWHRTMIEKWNDAHELKKVRQMRERAQEESAAKMKREQTEFDELVKRWEREDIQRYGEPRQIRRMMSGELERILRTIGECDIEGVISIVDPLIGHFTYERVECEAANGMEAATLLEMAMKDKLRLLFMPEVNFFKIPFQVDYRKNVNGHFVGLTIGVGRPTFQMGTYHLFIREKNPLHQNA